MAGQSKLRALDSIPYTCYEVGHTWNSSCLFTYLGVFKEGFLYSFKIYSTLYTLGLLAKLRNKNARTKATIKKYILEILQSSLFLSMNCTYFLMTFCAYGKIFGKYHRISGVIIGVICAALSIVLERKSRRGLLALYVLNLALESVYRIAVARGTLTPIKNIEVYLFVIANTLGMGMFRGSNLPRYFQDTFEKVLGKDEVGVSGLRKYTSPRSRKVTENLSFISSLIQKIKAARAEFGTVGPRHKRCLHEESCLAYATTSVVKYFTLGYGIQFILNLRSFVQAVVAKNGSGIGKVLQDISLAKFFCAYSTLFRVTNCLLRWILDRDQPRLFGALSGFVAGFSALYYKSAAVSMYYLLKLLEILFQKAVVKKHIPTLPHADILVYSLSMGVLFHCAIFEPHNIRPVYWKFLCNLSDQKFKEMFRKMFVVFGTDATRLYPKFVPNLDPRFVKSEDIKKVLSSAGKWRGLTPL